MSEKHRLVATTLSIELFAYCTDKQIALLGTTSALEGILTALLERGRSAWPALSLSESTWCANIASHLPPDDVVEGYLQPIVAEDFYLATACGSPDAACQATARRLLSEHYLADLSAALIGIRMDPDQFRDVEQSVRTELIFGVEGRAPKLDSYSGRGPLRAWIRVVTARVALSLLRKKSPSSMDDDTLRLEQMASNADPELESLQRRYQDLFREAVTHAMESQSAEERNLLRLHYIDRLSIDDLAVTMNAHRATVARRIARIRESLFEATRAYITARLSLTPTEFRSLMGALFSELDVSVRRILG